MPAKCGCSRWRIFMEGPTVHRIFHLAKDIRRLTACQGGMETKR